jgi:hypothetical protein
MKWDASGVGIYFWPTGKAPSDVGTDYIQPNSWGTPQAFWPASSCDPYKFFSSHSAIFDTTLWYGINICYFEVKHVNKIIFLYAVGTGVPAFGTVPAYPARSSPAPSAQVTRHAKNSFAPMEPPSLRPVSFIRCALLCSLPLTTPFFQRLGGSLREDLCRQMITGIVPPLAHGHPPAP